MIRIVGMLHHAVRIDPSSEALAAAREFYGEFLGLEADPNRPVIQGVPGFWFNAGGPQIHVMGVKGQSTVGKSPDQDPTLPHVCLAVEDLQAVKRELAERGIDYWVLGGMGRIEQVFFYDPAGNVIELQPAGAWTKPAV